MAANFEAVVILVMAHEGGKWLNAHYPGEIDWAKSCYLTAIIIIGVLWFRMFRYMVRVSQQDEVDDKNKDKNL